MRLIGLLDEEAPEALITCARQLDKVYIPARYPDAYDAGAPLDYFTEADSQQAVDWAHRILNWLDDRTAQ